MRKSIITIALVCAVLVALCSCTTTASIASVVKPNVAASTPVKAAPVAAAPVATIPATTVTATAIPNLIVNGQAFAGDPIMRDAKGNALVVKGLTTAAGDPIMQTSLQTAAGDPIMMDAAGNYYVAFGSNVIMIAAAGDPIMLYK